MEKEIEASLPINRVNFGESVKTMQYLATLSVCFAAIGAGTVLAWSSPALTELAAPQEINSTNLERLDVLNQSKSENSTARFVLSKREEALVGSFLNLGALIYALPTGFIADKFGRKTAIYLSGVSYILGWFLVVIANDLTTLLLARFFGGMGLGAICVVAPVYIGEITESSLRATLSSYFPLSLGSGILITFIIGAYTDYVTMSGILAIFPILMLITLPFMPESHVYLAKTGKIKKAERSLTRFRGNHQGYDIQGEMEVIKEEINRNACKSSSFTDIIFKKSNRNAAIAAIGCLGLQQLCGINAVTFYTEQIFIAAGTNMDPSNGAIMMAVFQVGGSYLTMTLIEKAGRKYFLILSAIGMMMGLCGLGMFFHLQAYNYKHLTFGFLPIACAALFIVAFTAGFASVPFLLIHELFAPEVRGIGSGLGIVVMWVCSFILTYSFPISVLTLGNYVTFYIMTLINVVAIIFVVICVPETRGKTLIEIQEILGK